MQRKVMARKNNVDYYSRIIKSVLIVIAVLCVMYIVFFGHRYRLLFSCLTTISSVLLLLSVIGVQIGYLRIRERRWWHKWINTAVAIALCVSVFSGAYVLQSMYRSYQLSRFGTTAFAKVIGFESEYRRNGSANYATLQYDFENEIYNQKTENDDGFYQLDDSVKILFSKKDPELFEVVLSE